VQQKALLMRGFLPPGDSASGPKSGGQEAPGPRIGPRSAPGPRKAAKPRVLAPVCADPNRHRRRGPCGRPQPRRGYDLRSEVTCSMAPCLNAQHLSAVTARRALPRTARRAGTGTAGRPAPPTPTPGPSPRTRASGVDRR